MEEPLFDRFNLRFMSVSDARTDSFRPLGVDAMLLTVGNNKSAPETVFGLACMTYTYSLIKEYARLLDTYLSNNPSANGMSRKNDLDVRSISIPGRII